jgi:hypothetical protein
MYYNQISSCPYYMNQASYPSLNARWREMTQRFASVSGTVIR